MNNSLCFSYPDLWWIFILTGAISFWIRGGPWCGSWTGSMDRVHGVVHGPGPSGGPWTPVHVLYTSRITSIVCVRVTSSNSQIQNWRATKGFNLIRHKRYQIYTCLQLSSSIATFVWKLSPFEFRSYGGAWHKAKIAFVEKYTLISWFLAILGV